MESFVDLNAFAVQYRYESLYANEDSVDRSELADKIESLIEQVAAVLVG